MIRGTIALIYGMFYIPCKIISTTADPFSSVKKKKKGHYFATGFALGVGKGFSKMWKNI